MYSRFKPQSSIKTTYYPPYPYLYLCLFSPSALVLHIVLINTCTSRQAKRLFVNIVSLIRDVVMSWIGRCNFCVLSDMKEGFSPISSHNLNAGHKRWQTVIKGTNFRSHSITQNNSLGTSTPKIKTFGFEESNLVEQISLGERGVFLIM